MWLAHYVVRMAFGLCELFPSLEIFKNIFLNFISIKKKIVINSNCPDRRPLSSFRLFFTDRFVHLQKNETRKNKKKRG